MSNIKQKMLSLIVLPLSLLTMQPLQPKAEIEKPLYWENPAPIEVIQKYSDEYKIDANLLYSVLYCESRLDPQTKSGDSNRSHGIAQIKDGTWESLEKRLGHELDKKSYLDAIRLTAYAFSINEGRNWTPYRAIKNGGSYTFTNVHTGKEQTVYCKYQTIPSK